MPCASGNQIIPGKKFGFMLCSSPQEWPWLTWGPRAVADSVIPRAVRFLGDSVRTGWQTRINNRGELSNSRILRRGKSVNWKLFPSRCRDRFREILIHFKFTARLLPWFEGIFTSKFIVNENPERAHPPFKKTLFRFLSGSHRAVPRAGKRGTCFGCKI